MERSKVARGWRHQAAVITGVLGWAMTALPMFALMLAVGMPALPAFLVATAIGLVSGVISFNSNKSQSKDRLRVYFQEQYGKRDSFPFEIELKEDGLTTRQLGVQSTYEWSNVEEIRQTENTIEFYLLGNAIIFVRKRAFHNENEQDKFAMTAQHYLNTSRNASNWLRDGE